MVKRTSHPSIDIDSIQNIKSFSLAFHLMVQSLYLNQMIHGSLNLSIHCAFQICYRVATIPFRGCSLFTNRFIEFYGVKGSTKQRVHTAYSRLRCRSACTVQWAIADAENRDDIPKLADDQSSSRYYVV
jgi:hypothetical protein